MGPRQVPSVQRAGRSRRRRADRNRKSPLKPRLWRGAVGGAKDHPAVPLPSRLDGLLSVCRRPRKSGSGPTWPATGQRSVHLFSTPPRAFPAPVALTSSLGGFSWVFPKSPMARRAEPLWPLPASRPPSPRPGALGQPPGRGRELKRGRRRERLGKQKCACACSLTTHAHSCPGRSCALGLNLDALLIYYQWVSRPGRGRKQV